MTRLIYRIWRQSGWEAPTFNHLRSNPCGHTGITFTDNQVIFLEDPSVLLRNILLYTHRHRQTDRPRQTDRHTHTHTHTQAATWQRRYKRKQKQTTIGSSNAFEIGMKRERKEILHPVSVAYIYERSIVHGPSLERKIMSAKKNWALRLHSFIASTWCLKLVHCII